MKKNPALVAELVEILDRFTALSEGASRACEASDVEGVNRALDAREVVLARARKLAPVLDSGALPREVRDRLAAVARADADLTTVLNRATAQTRTELDRIGTSLVAVGGYAAAMPRFRRLDLRR